jgi:hypothetical protein
MKPSGAVADRPERTQIYAPVAPKLREETNPVGRIVAPHRVRTRPKTDPSRARLRSRTTRAAAPKAMGSTDRLHARDQVFMTTTLSSGYVSPLPAQATTAEPNAQQLPAYRDRGETRDFSIVLPFDAGTTASRLPRTMRIACGACGSISSLVARRAR